MDDRTCKWDGCDKDWIGQGYCSNHYQHARRRGMIEKIERPHTITNADIDAMVADCSTCGDSVPILLHSTGHPTCRQRSRDASRKRWREKQDDLRAYHREYGRAYKYRMKRESLDKILNVDDLSCEICEKPLDMRKARIDHDHACCDGRRQTCGECFRGILCNSCNSALGLFADDVERMARAVTYVLTRGVRSQSGKHKRSA